MNKYSFDTLTPEDIKRMTDEELIKLCEFLQVKSVDFVIVKDLIRDRNEFRSCYNKLYGQLLALGVEPAINYFKKD